MVGLIKAISHYANRYSSIRIRIGSGSRNDRYCLVQRLTVEFSTLMAIEGTSLIRLERPNTIRLETG